MVSALSRPVVSEAVHRACAEPGATVIHNSKLWVDAKVRVCEPKSNDTA